MLGLVALGLSNRQIGERVGMTQEIVKHRLHLLFPKIGVKDRTAAALRAHELGLVPDQGAAERVAASVPPDAVTLLTAQDRRTLGLVGEGLSNKEIGRALNLAESTVKNRLSAIFRKLAVPDRTQAALVAVRLGVVRINDEDGRPNRRKLQNQREHAAHLRSGLKIYHDVSQLGDASGVVQSYARLRLQCAA